MARIIVYDGRQHPDPDPTATIDEVKDIMSQFYPDIATATHKTEKHGTDTHYVFTKRVGTKGNGSHTLLAELVLTTPPVRLDALPIYSQLANPDGIVDSTQIQAYLQADPTNDENLEGALNQLTHYSGSVRTLTARLLANLEW